jgi:hypothetical protein
MENNLHQRWIQLPKVRVEFENVLTVNSKHVSLPDITPEILGDYIDIGREEIDYELNRVVKRQKFWDETFQATQPPIILLGKLALSEHEYNVFTAATRFNKDRVSVNVEQLQEPYRGYWMAIEERLYVPIVQRNFAKGSLELSGTWLGLGKPFTRD